MTDIKLDDLFNLNEYVWAKLNEKGRVVHRAYWEPICIQCHLPYEYPAVNDEGWSRFQMHEVMMIFGPHLIGNSSVPFETLCIRINPTEPFIPVVPVAG